MRTRRPPYAQFLRGCLRLGLTGFGGGAATLANLQQLAVRRNGWLTARELFYMASVAQLLPGGVAANTVTLVANRFYGRSRAVLALAAFVAPPAVFVLAAALAYPHLSQSADFRALLRGMGQAVIGLVVAIAIRLVPEALLRGWQWVIAACAGFAASMLNYSAVEVLAASAATGAIIDYVHKTRRMRAIRRLRDGREPAEPPIPPEPPAPEHLGARLAPVAVLITLPALASVASVFLKLGLAAYGGGYALVPTLYREAVLDHQWLSPSEFRDAIAVAQVAPGPMLLVSTFLGWKAAGAFGAVIATITIFAGPCALALSVGAGLERWRRTPIVKSLLRGIAPAVLGLLAAAAVIMGRESITGVRSVGLALFAFVAIYRFRYNPALVLVVAGVANVALHRFE